MGAHSMRLQQAVHSTRPGIPAGWPLRGANGQDAWRHARQASGAWVRDLRC